MDDEVQRRTRVCGKCRLRFGTRYTTVTLERLRWRLAEARSMQATVATQADKRRLAARVGSLQRRVRTIEGRHGWL